MDGSTTLGDLADEPRYAVFDELQQHLPHVWDAMACIRVPLDAVVRSRLIDGTTTADSSGRSRRMASHTCGRCCWRSSKTA